MEKTEARWVEVFKVSLPLCLSYVPIGLACGILLHAAGINFIGIRISILRWSSVLDSFYVNYEYPNANDSYYAIFPRVTLCVVGFKFVTIY